MNHLTRRATLGVLIAAGAVPPALAQGARLPTAREVFAAIKTASKQPWDPNPTDDRIIYGDLATPITGIATCFVATLDILKAAKAAGLNYIIPHEATFYERYDDFAESVIPDNDPVLAAKLRFIRDNNMVVQRMHGHAHSMEGDFITAGLIDKLGWTPYRLDPPRPVAVKIPPASAMAVGRHIKTSLGRRTLRMFGDPNQTVSTLTVSSGMPGENAQIAQMEFPGVDAVVLGEVREPEVLGYAQDLAAKRKIVVYLSGHTSEDFGMRLLAEWTQGVFPQMPVRWLPTTDPYTNPV